MKCMYCYKSGRNYSFRFLFCTINVFAVCGRISKNNRSFVTYLIELTGTLVEKGKYIVNIEYINTLKDLWGESDGN